MREKKSSLRFTGRQHARGGVVSIIIAGISWIIFIALCVYSSSTGGNAEMVAGGIGLVDAVFTLAGMVMAFRGFKERDVYYLFPTVGIMLNGILFVTYFSLYFMGIVI